MKFATWIFKLGLSLCLINSAVDMAFAQRGGGSSSGGKTEYYYQPGAGGLAFEAGYGMWMPEYKSTLNVSGTATSETKVKGSWYNLGLQYGLSGSLSLGVSTAFKSDETSTTTLASSSTSTTKSTGMTDVTVALTNVNDMGSWGLALAGGVDYSPEKRKSATATKDGNQVSGGTHFFGQFGLYTNLSQSVLGIDLKYTMKGERTTIDQSATPETESKSKGGNQTAITAFFELPLGGWLFDVKGGVVSTDAVQNEAGTTTANAYTYNNAGVGLQTQLTSAFNIRAEYNMAMIPEIAAAGSTTTKVAAFTMSSLDLRLRFTF